jgi:ion channel-forming bestrophin family protein
MIDYDAHQWMHHLFDIKGSMLREIVGRILLCGAWSVGVVVLHFYVHPLDIPSTVHALVGVALGLLLVFRTNASYDRFWEGRKQWGAIVNESRNLARASSVHLAAKEPALHASVVRWTVAWVYATMHNLRGQRGLGPITSALPAPEVEEVLEAQHIPLEVSRRISSLLVGARDKGLVSDWILLSLDNNVQLLIDYMGACERIRRTPLPFAYVVHLRRALILYFLTLPFALLVPFGWLSLVAVLFVAYVFFGIEEIGVEIEDPFGHDDNDLPLERICSTIEGNLLALLENPPGTAPGREQVPPPAATGLSMVRGQE